MTLNSRPSCLCFWSAGITGLPPWPSLCSSEAHTQAPLWGQAPELQPPSLEAALLWDPIFSCLTLLPLEPFHLEPVAPEKQGSSLGCPSHLLERTKQKSLYLWVQPGPVKLVLLGLGRLKVGGSLGFSAHRFWRCHNPTLAIGAVM